ncbi:putative protein phosphatase 2C 23 [Forsythia ovata]|uniref:Uncharacterized protein n=1 Tax=Forsythia ovata TaxID=205694 RepID=A0ABD1S903_9LAMI
MKEHHVVINVHMYRKPYKLQEYEGWFKTWFSPLHIQSSESKPELTRLSSSKVHTEYEEASTTTFRSISGAAVSANTSTPLSTAFVDHYSYNSIDRASAFESSTSFASIPLQIIPRNSGTHSGPLFNHSGLIPNSGPMERGFMSGPIERGFSIIRA